MRGTWLVGVRRGCASRAPYRPIRKTISHEIDICALSSPLSGMSSLSRVIEFDEYAHGR